MKTRRLMFPRVVGCAALAISTLAGCGNKNSQDAAPADPPPRTIVTESYPIRIVFVATDALIP